MRTPPLVLVVAVLFLGCGLREMRIESTISAYDVRPLRGQDAAQMQADIEACKARLLEEPGQLELAFPAATGVYGTAVDVERAKRYERCLAEFGYKADLRLMTGGAGDRGR